MNSKSDPKLRGQKVDAMCKKCESYHGSSCYDGYCSKCYRDRQTHPIQTHLHRDGADQTSSQFEKFQKKRSKPEKSTISKVTSTLRKSTSRAGAVFSENGSMLNEIGQPHPCSEGALDGQKITKQQNEFLDKRVQSFRQILQAQKHSRSIEDISESVQRFYQDTSKCLENNALFKDLSEEDREQILDSIERNVMTSLHASLFCPSHIEEEKDLAIQERIRKLKWIGAKHLDCRFNEMDPKVRHLIYLCLDELLGLDSATAPQDKLQAVVHCCRNIFNLLKQSVDTPASADEFLPALIYIVLKGNPPRLKSNINFVSRFCNATRLMTGEGGYYFTNLCCAISFIENLKAESLNMPQEEFEQYMTGAVVPASPWESFMMCEGMHFMRDHVATLENMRKKAGDVINDTENLGAEMQTYMDNMECIIGDLIREADLSMKRGQKSEVLPSPVKPPKKTGPVRPVKAAKTPDTPKKEEPRSSAISLPEYAFPSETELERLAADDKINVNESLPVAYEFFSLDPSTPDELSAAQASLTFVQGLSGVNYDIDFPETIDAGNGQVSSPCATPSRPADSGDGPTSILDISESPTAEMLLPSPIKPLTTTPGPGWRIPTIPCDTGSGLSETQRLDTTSSQDCNFVQTTDSLL